MFVLLLLKLLILFFVIEPAERESRRAPKGETCTPRVGLEWLRDTRKGGCMIREGEENRKEIK